LITADHTSALTGFNLKKLAMAPSTVAATMAP
jgi:hypothetical protein